MLNDEGYCSTCASVRDPVAHCIGCGDGFIETDGTQFCENCSEVLKEGRCLTCLRERHEYKFISEDGRCDICEWNNIHLKKCKICNHNNAYGGIPCSDYLETPKE